MRGEFRESIQEASGETRTQACVSGTHFSTAKSKVLKYGQSLANVSHEGIIIATRMTNKY